ncbi:MAG: thiol reductant ABC exporter subunit CydD [Chloroflexi bacterium HGW-Chloroflexi-5]|jgi:ATP-binding cassette subfamily C protein CydD|nr:MAG: thiol reductant ABC exporter subunit CydD [Chloroflexi bacterium HGW-Chloroflexi-5]
MNKNARLFQKARSTGLLFPLIVVFGFLAGGLVVWQSWLLSEVISKVFLAKQTLAQVLPLLQSIILVVLGRSLFTIINESLAGKLAVKVKDGLREELFKKINQLGPSFLKGEKSGELTTTALQGLDALDAYFSQYLPQILLSALLPITILLVVFPADVLTGIVFVITAPLIPYFMILIGRLSHNHTKRQWIGLSRLGAYFLDTLQGLSTLMQLGQSRDRGVKIRQASERYRIVTMNVFKVTFLSAFVLEMIATISTALVAVEIGLRLLYGNLEFQQAFFILLIAPEFYLPLRNLSVRYHAGMNGLTAAGRIFQLLDTPEISAIPSAVEKVPAQLAEKFSLSFQSVSYHYPDNPEAALKEINLELESGRHYALIGESGAGKSTLAQLIMRFIVPENGSICVNGEDIQTWNLDQWRSMIAWVPQKAKLFNTSLLENVRLHNPAYSAEAVFFALEKAGLEKFVQQLPEGLQTPLLEGGVRLSGGEAQRVMLARAFLKNAPLLLMDEPTAHLDIDLERSFLETSERLQDGRTTLTIAHRLATVIQSDQIFVLKRGQLVEKGTHLELRSLQGDYAHLLEDARRRV